MQRLVGILVAIGIGVGLFLYRSQQTAEVEANEEATAAAVIDFVMSRPDSAKFSSYLDEHLGSACEYAHSIAFTEGRRRSAAKFDPDKFALCVGENLLSQSKLNPKTRDDQALGVFLRQLQIDIESAVKEGKLKG